ncbi:MAG: AIPR family protein [Pyrinomonadaceae bacterium]|nr:AIPR family protein [Pyrinomonadaceae bacterium]
MPDLSPEIKAVLEERLDTQFVPHLPAPTNGLVGDPLIQFNRSRALAAFAISKICGISEQEACLSVVDGGDDGGLDAIHFDSKVGIVYFIQSKLKNGISQAEILKLVNGTKKILTEQFATFNQYVKDREAEIKGAVFNCERIELVLAFTGTDIGHHGLDDAQAFLNDKDFDERLADKVFRFDAAAIKQSLSAEHNHPSVNADLFVEGCSSVGNPRRAFFGVVKLGDLVELHKKHESALYQRNIRNTIKRKSEVNDSIRDTLSDSPNDFFFLNNGITGLCTRIRPANPVEKGRTLRVEGLSIVNGAQTIGSALRVSEDDPQKDLSGAKVGITLIQTDPSSDFGDQITRCRNHQNEVKLTDFVALDGEQESLRKELAVLGFEYVYKTGVDRDTSTPDQIFYNEAFNALSIVGSNYKVLVQIRKRPTQSAGVGSPVYKELFHSGLSALSVVNAVKINRFFNAKIDELLGSSGYTDARIYQQGRYLLAWLVIRPFVDAIAGPGVLSDVKINNALARPFDEVRELLLVEAKKQAAYASASKQFSSYPRVVTLIRYVLDQAYGLSIDDHPEWKIIEERNPDGFIRFLLGKVQKRIFHD